MRADVSRWLARRTYRASSYSAPRLLAAKHREECRVSVVLPALDEERTVGPIVASIREAFVERLPLVDELVVVDSGSSDRTATVAAAAGARVVHVDDVLPAHGHVPGRARRCGSRCS